MQLAFDLKQKVPKIFQNSSGKIIFFKKYTGFHISLRRITNKSTVLIAKHDNLLAYILSYMSVFVKKRTKKMMT